MPEDLGELIAERRHDRSAIGGPLAVLILTGLLAWGAWGTWGVFSLGGAAFRVVASVLLAGGVAVVVADLRRWNDRISVYEEGTVQKRFGRTKSLRHTDIDRVEYSIQPRGVLFGVAMPFPLNLLLRGLGSAFSLRVVPVPGATKPLVLRAAYRKSKPDQIDKVAMVLTAKVRARMLVTLRRGEAAVWTPRLLLTPEEVLVLRRPLGEGVEPSVKRTVPLVEIRKTEIRHGHLLVWVHGRRRCVINNRQAARVPAGWSVLCALLSQRQGVKPDDAADGNPTGH